MNFGEIKFHIKYFGSITWNTPKITNKEEETAFVDLVLVLRINQALNILSLNVCEDNACGLVDFLTESE